MATKPIRGEKGRFNGSIGDGGRNTPVTPPTAAAPPAPGEAAAPAVLAPFPMTPVEDFADPRTVQYTADRDVMSEAFGECPHLHRCLAANRNLDPEVAVALAERDSDRFDWVDSDHIPVWLDLVNNPACPAEALDVLVDKDDEEVRWAARAHPNYDARSLYRRYGFIDPVDAQDVLDVNFPDGFLDGHGLTTLTDRDGLADLSPDRMLVLRVDRDRDVLIDADRHTGTFVVAALRTSGAPHYLVHVDSEMRGVTAADLPGAVENALAAFR